jgi:hypothetical protein
MDVMLIALSIKNLAVVDTGCFTNGVEKNPVHL